MGPSETFGRSGPSLLKVIPVAWLTRGAALIMPVRRVQHRDGPIVVALS